MSDLPLCLRAWGNFLSEPLCFQVCSYLPVSWLKDFRYRDSADHVLVTKAQQICPWWFLSALQYLRNTWKEFHYIIHKCLHNVNDELRWRSHDPVRHGFILSLCYCADITLKCLMDVMYSNSLWHNNVLLKQFSDSVMCKRSSYDCATKRHSPDG